MQTPDSLPNNIRLENGGFNAPTIAAVSLLVSRHPPFLGYAFGLMMARLNDQLTNKANVLIVKNDALMAYAGWIVVRDAEAKKWLIEGGELPTPDWKNGDAAIVTITVTEDQSFLLPLIRAVSTMCAGKKVYRMRSFQNGKADMRRMPITGRAQSFISKPASNKDPQSQ